ncbi:10 kDa chaperonin 1, chloroplastic-like [Cucurbita pepo subsp. pepo]|uniref:10 kDa chaperonin 1, chloroplastic-like n=1 Tax=Cucurbita maxima TaxID=3661 RepID=A0A6J1KWR7_CUCMA|nr:10 kDa chaperonin 1, chloroplastic-like [Cucurbita maxima]XP_023006782.1 10 kDa chaperonin 1, chloroplastic-like [Cucurbita maxima]XP_023549322.1 10 kDa chaperonin 1, chloroplastic-like [Cucurbita pepo subsp. pepo]
MASMFLTVKPFVNKIDVPTLSNRRIQSTRRTSLKVCAVSKKLEPAKVVPQGDRVLIRLEELPEKSAGGVLLPKSAVKFERYLLGEILSTGADAGELGQGKKVLFSDISAYEVDLGTDAKHVFCKASDLLAVVE